MKTLNILFLGGAKRVSLAEFFIQSGKKRGYQTAIFSYELNSDVPISFIGKIIPGKKWNDENILADLRHIIEREQIHIVIPSLDPATLIAAKLKPLVGPNCFIPVSDLELCNLFFNKQLAYNWCLHNNVPVAEPKYQFPLIAKPVNGSASKGIIRIDNNDAYEQFRHQHNISDFNIQQFITGKEYSVDAYVNFNSGKMVAAVPRIRLEMIEGEAVKSMTVRNNELIRLSKEIISKSGLKGPLTLQFIQDKTTGVFYFMEINPRFGGGVVTSIAAGSDLTGYLIDDMSGIAAEENNADWAEHFLMVRRFSEFYKQLENPSTYLN
jgi:carbamoyl-phosphate synthase large subunit